MIKIKIKKTNRFFLAIFFLSIIYWGFEISNDAGSMGSYDEEILDKKIEGIANVTDGDTIKIADKRVRLIWIDAPETKQNCFDQDDNEYACGVVSKEFLINLAQGKEVVCYYAKLDIYKRYLGECYVDKISLNKKMIENGMAVIYSFKKFNPELKEFQETAKDNKRGIWRGKFELPRDYRRNNKK